MTSNKRPILVLLTMLLLAVIAGMLVNRDRSGRVLTALEQVSGQAKQAAKTEQAAETKPEAKPEAMAKAEQKTETPAEPQAVTVLAAPVGPMPWEIVEDDGSVPAWRRKAETILYALLPDLAPPIPRVFPDSSPLPERSEAELAAERETSAKLAAAALERIVPQIKTAPAKLDAAPPATAEQKAPAQAATAASPEPAKEPQSAAASSVQAAATETTQTPGQAKTPEPAAATPVASAPSEPAKAAELAKAADPAVTTVPDAAPETPKQPEKSPAELAAERQNAAKLAATLEAIIARGKPTAAKPVEKPAPAAPPSQAAQAKAEGPQGPSRQAPPDRPGEITGIALECAPLSCTLRIETTSEVERVNLMQLTKPARMAVDLYGHLTFKGLPPLPGDVDFVERIRLGTHPDHFRVVLDFRGDPDPTRGQTTFEKRGNTVLVKIPK